MSIAARLKELGIELPAATAPMGAFVPYVRTGNLVFLSGHIAKRDGRPWIGQLGAEISPDEGRQAARAVAIDLLGTLQEAVGDLERVQRHRQASGAGEQCAGFHGATGGGERCLGAFRRDLRGRRALTRAARSARRNCRSASASKSK
jgi:hypothetical protein